LKTESASSDNRLFRRFAQHRMIRIHADSEVVDAVVDVSLSGVCFDSKQSLKLGEKLKVGLTAWNEDQPKAIEGTIVWRDIHSNGYRYGLRFDKPVLPDERMN